MSYITLWFFLSDNQLLYGYKVIFDLSHLLPFYVSLFLTSNTWCLHIENLYMCKTITNVFKFYMMLTRHIIYCLLHILPHVLRIKWCGPSWHADSISTIFDNPKITPVLGHWYAHQSGPPVTTCEWEYQILHRPHSGSSCLFIFREPTFIKWLSQANIAFYTFSSKSHLALWITKTRSFCQWYIPPLG